MRYMVYFQPRQHSKTHGLGDPDDAERAQKFMTVNEVREICGLEEVAEKIQRPLRRRQDVKVWL